EYPAVPGCGWNRYPKADDALQEQRGFEWDIESEGAKADRERRGVLDPEHQRPEDDTCESPRTLEHRKPFDDAVRGTNHPVRGGDRQDAPRDALHEHQPG